MTNSDTGDISNLVTYRLQRAQETLNDAYILAERGSAVSAANRLYYACFYAVLAYLASIGVFPKTHNGVRQMMGQHMILTGIVDRDMGAFYSDVLNLRISGDYDDFTTIPPDDLSQMLHTAHSLISKIRDLLSS